MLTDKPSFQYALVSIFYIALSFYLYAAVADHEFLHWDDKMYIGANPHIQELNGKNLWWMLTQSYAGNWHPLTWLSHAVDYALWGDNPKMYHLTNIFIHAINTILFFFLTLNLLNYKTRHTKSDTGLKRPNPGAFF